MARIGNEAKLILKLAKERMKAEHKNWLTLRSNPNSNSASSDWLTGWEYANREWEETLSDVVSGLEK